MAVGLHLQPREPCPCERPIPSAISAFLTQPMLVSVGDGTVDEDAAHSRPLLVAQVKSTQNMLLAWSL